MGSDARTAIDAANVRVAAWIERWCDRFAAEHAEVQTEIRDEALRRFMADGRIAWEPPGEKPWRGRVVQSLGDTEACRMRVVSRHRLKIYGAIPDNAGEWKRQANEVRRALGMAPIGEACDQEPPAEARQGPDSRREGESMGEAKRRRR